MALAIPLCKSQWRWARAIVIDQPPFLLSKAETRASPNGVALLSFRRTYPFVTYALPTAGGTRTMIRGRWFLASVALATLALPSAAVAQQSEATTDSAPADQVIKFAADTVTYDQIEDIVTANGQVLLDRDGYRLSADSVVWNRRTGAVEAIGNVRAVSPNGDIVYGDRVELTDSLRDGVIENILLVMADGGRLAAHSGERSGDKVVLNQAAYSPCSVVDANGCPKEPTWQVKATRVKYDQSRDRVSYDNARIELFGLPVVPLPGLSHSVNKVAETGILVPDIRYSRNNGLEVSLPYYWRFSDNRDATLTGHVYTEVAPMVHGNYRALLSKGAYQIDAYGTYGSRIGLDTSATDEQKGLRGYVAATGRYQFDHNWQASGSIRYASDRTFLRRYDISRDDRLRNTLALERIDSNSYFAVRGWSVQTLRTDDVQGLVPVALPEIDYRLRMSDHVLGGTVKIQANSLALTRTSGQDTQRAFASARWDKRWIMGGGQLVTASLFGRGDLYHTNDNSLTNELYRGLEGWHTRGIATAALDMSWPLLGAAFGGAQVITPRVQIVASPTLSNLDVPNEDARSIDLEDSNLFALNRFPGYDRFEDNVRITYGLDWQFDRRDVSISANVGQSYRLSNRASILPDGTGLSDRLSDVVGRVEVRWLDRVNVTTRFRIDKDNAALRRFELDGTVGSRQTYASVGYLRLNRDIPTTVEDLRDREEIRFGARVQVTPFWSIFGSGIVDLTDAEEDPNSTADGFRPIRTRLGVAYDDDCLTISVTWRRDYQDTGDALQGDSVLFRLSFRNLGI